MELTNYRISISYDGRNYFGFQILDSKMSIGKELLTALQAIDQRIETLNASGRTDAGVHALKQVVNFYSAMPLNLNEWKRALNGFLPLDIRVNSIRKVHADFHARYNVKMKEYTYIINTGRFDLFKKDYQWHIPYALDIEKIKEGAKLFLGQHDFTNFTIDNLETKHTLVRTIKEIIIKPTKKGFAIIFRGDGFLRAQVRMMVGALVKLGAGKIQIDDLKGFIELNKVQKWTFKAPACGLYLSGVTYD